MLPRRLVNMFLLLAVSGCANQNAIFRSSRIDMAPRVLTMDAKQRNLVMIPNTDVKWRVCAEASPDVFSALSTSAAADLGFGTSGSEGRARAALAISEAAGSIERTQTINLLRESMYRTCERFMSGAIERDAFVIQAGRDQRAMVAILAIEQLTRTARPPATILIAGETGAVITSPGEMATELSRTARAAEAAKIRLEVTTRTLDAAKCDDLPATASDESIDTTSRRARCVELSTARNLAAEELRLAEAERNAMANASALRSAPLPQTAAETSHGVGIAGGGDAPRAGTDLAAVAEVIKYIADLAFKGDETQLFCLQYLSSGQGEPGPALPADASSDLRLQRTTNIARSETLRERCTAYALGKVEAETRALTQPAIKGQQ